MKTYIKSILGILLIIGLAWSCGKTIDAPTPTTMYLDASRNFGKKIELNWVAQGENVVYRVYRTKDAGYNRNGEYIELGTTKETFYEDKDLQYNQIYYYYVVVELSRIRAYKSQTVEGRTTTLTAEEAFTELAEGTGGQRYDAPNAGSVPDIIIKIINDHAQKQTSDVIFLIDNTASMGDDISSVKSSLNRIIDILPKNTRLGIGTYNDRNVDSNWYQFSDLSTDYEVTRGFLNRISVYGGGDVPESVYDGIYETVERATWRSPKRIIIVIGDAPPLEGDRTKYTYKNVVDKCNEKGIEANLYPILIKG